MLFADETVRSILDGTDVALYQSYFTRPFPVLLCLTIPGRFNTDLACFT